MVLSRAFLVLLAAAAAAGCGQSLFDASGKPRGDGGTGDDANPDADVPKTCPTECLADAAADFDKQAPRVRYIEDRAGAFEWLAMEPLQGDVREGSGDPRNKIQRCAPGSSLAACQALPDALLVTSADTSPYNPAIEYKSTAKQVLHLVVRAHVPNDSAAPQTIRLYRNSREDILFQAPMLKGAGAMREVVVDALPDDRFMVAVEPMTAFGAGGTAAIHFYVSRDVRDVFPVKCQLAASFEMADGSNAFPDLCKSRNLSSATGVGGGMTVPPVPTSGPYGEQGLAVDLAPGRFLVGPPLEQLDRTGPVTVQFWVKVDAVMTSPAWAFTDLDVDTGDGAGLMFFSPPAPMVEVKAIRNTNPYTEDAASRSYVLGGWHFLRIVDAAGALKVCLDGNELMKTAVRQGRTSSSNAPHFGKVADVSTPAFFDGAFDDVRVFSEALPCGPE